MSQDDDIARIAAALHTPGLKYRNFGNQPVRPDKASAEHSALTNSALNAAIGGDIAIPTSVEDPRSTMKLIAEPLPRAAPPTVGPYPAAAAPAWPLLDALAQPPEPCEPAAGTLVQLFSGALAPSPAAASAAVAAPPAPASMPAALPLAAFAPLPAASPPPIASPQPAATAPGPFPAAWTPQVPATEPAGSPAMVPADRVTTPLTELLQTIGRGGPAANPAFAALRLPGNRAR